MGFWKETLTMIGVFLLICLSSVTADVIYVATDGNDITGDGSNGSPYRTIQKGINEATNGDTVRVKNGTYTGSGNVNVSLQGKAILVTSNDQVTTPDYLIVDCGGSPNRAFVFENGESNSTVLSNFTIRNGDVRTRVVNFQDDKNGGAIKMLASPKIINCVFQSCQARVAGAIYINVPSNNPDSPIIEDCRFSSNSATVTATDGGAVYCGTNAGVTIDHCTFAYNVSGRDGGAVFVSSYLAGRQATIEYCAFYRNKARTTGTGYGGALRLEGRTVVRSSNFFRNIAGEGCGVSVSGDSGIVTIENCNITFNSSSGIQVLNTADLGMECSNMYSNSGGHIVGTVDTSDYAGELIFEDPLFCDTASADFTLSSFSPCAHDSSPCEWYIGQYYMPTCDRCCNLAGDVNNDGIGPDLSDLNYLVNYMTYGGPPPPCMDEGNVNGVDQVDLSDEIYMVNYLFLGGPAPVCP